MADNLHKLAIEIQGDIDARFGDSIRDMQSHLKQLEDGVKSISDSKVTPDPISKKFMRMNHEAGVAAQELNKLNSQMKQVDGYVKQRKETAEATLAFRNARNEVRRLETAQKEAGTKEFASQIKAAKKEATAAERAYNKQRTTLDNLDGKLKDAGIDTKKLGDEHTRLAGEIEDATEKSKKFGDQMERLTRAKYHFNQLRGHVKQLGSDILWVGGTWAKMIAGIGVGGFGLYKLSDSVAAAGDAAAKSAAKLHMGIEAFQELNYAASLSGVKNFDGMMVKFNASLANMSANTKSGPGKELKALGINVEQFSKMKPEYAIMAMADTLNKIQDPAKRARAEMALFGKSGAEMGAFLTIGSSGMKKLCDEARSTGLVISAEAAKQAEAFNDARDKMKGTISGLKNTIGVELIPVFTDMFGELSKFFIDNQAMVKDFAVNLGSKFREMLPTFMQLAQGVGKFIDVMWNIGKVVMDLVGGVENFGIVIAALPLLKPALTVAKLVGSLGGLISSLSGVSGAIGLIGKALFANPIGIGIGLIAGGALLIYKYWEPIRGFFSGLWSAFSRGIDSAVGAGMAVFGALPGWLQDVLGPVGDIIAMPYKVGYEVVKGVIGFFKGDFKSIPEALKDTFAGVKRIITKPFGDAFGWVETKWASPKNWLGMGPTINAEVEGVDVANVKRGRARGGMQSSPSLVAFAERGPEVAVPLGIADRSYGLASLNMASRALGYGSVANPTSMEERAKRATTVQNRNLRIEAKFPLPTINLTVNGGDPEEIHRVVIEVMREIGASMIPEWQEQIERVSYGTT